MTTKRQTSLEAGEANLPKPVQQPLVLDLWFVCERKDFRQDEDRTLNPLGSDYYQDHLRSVMETAWGQSKKGFQGQVLCRALLSYPKSTFPDEELSRLRGLRESLQKMFDSCEKPLRLLLPLQTPNDVSIFLFPEGRFSS